MTLVNRDVPGETRGKEWVVPENERAKVGDTLDLALLEQTRSHTSEPFTTLGVLEPLGDGEETVDVNKLGKSENLFLAQSSTQDEYLSSIDVLSRVATRPVPPNHPPGSLGGTYLWQRFAPIMFGQPRSPGAARRAPPPS